MGRATESVSTELTYETVFLNIIFIFIFLGVNIFITDSAGATIIIIIHTAEWKLVNFCGVLFQNNLCTKMFFMYTNSNGNVSLPTLEGNVTMNIYL